MSDETGFFYTESTCLGPSLLLSTWETEKVSKMRSERLANTRKTRSHYLTHIFILMASLEYCIPTSV